jgi:PAS domain S-box-containing protein
MINADRFSEIYKVSRLPTLILFPANGDFTIFGANAAYFQATGTKKNNLAGKLVSELSGKKMNIATDDVKDLHHSLLTAFKSGIAHKIICRQYHSSLASLPISELKFWRIENIPFLDKDCKVEYIIHTLSEVEVGCYAKNVATKTHQQHRPESALAALDKIMTYSPDVICTIDRHGKFINVSAASEKLWGYTQEEMATFSYADIIVTDDLELTKAERLKILRGFQMTNITNRCIRKDGRILPVIWSGRWDEAGKVMYCVARDGTEKKKSELEKSLLLHNTDEAFILLDKQLNIVDYNYKFKTLYEKYLQQEVVKGKSILDYAKPERRHDLKNLYDKVLQGYQKTTKISIPVKGEPDKFYFLKYKPALNEDNAIIGVFVTAKDVTEIVVAKEQVEASEEKYRLLFNKSPIPKWVLEIETLKILDVNDSAVSHYGYSRNEFLDMLLHTISPREDLREMKSIYENKKQKELIHFGIFTQLKKDQSKIMAEVTGQVFSYMGRDCMLMESNDVTERESALQKLKENEIKLLSAQKIAKLGYWQMLPYNNALYWSNEVYNIWGVDSSFELSHKKFLRTIHPEDRVEFKKEIKAVFARMKDHDFEHRILLPDGKVKWVREKGSLLLDDKGKVLLFEGTVQDITENKIARDKLLLSEARHRGIVDSQTNYVIRTDLHGNYTYCNNKFLNDFGWMYPGNNIIGKNALESIKSYHHARLKKTIEKCVANLNKVLQVELDKPKQDNDIITTLWDFICLTDSRGVPTEIQCVGIDISRRKKAEEALRESNSRYEYVSKATSDAIWDCNLETHVTYRGEGFEKLFGYDPKNIDNGKIPWTEYIHPDDRDRVIKSLEVFIDGKAIFWKDEYRYLKANGNYAFVLDKGFVVRNKKGKAVKMVGSMRDITKRKTLQELLSKSNRLARIGSWEIDALKNTVYWSSVTKEIREAEPDFEPDLTMGMHYFKKGKDRNTIKKRVKECKESGKPWDEELQIVTQKGNLKWVRTIGEAEMINGKCVKVYGSFQDIDEKKKAELEVMRLYEEKNTILESIGDGFFTVDKNWIVTYWNKQAEKMLLVSKKDIVGHHLWESFADSVDSESYKNYHRAVETKKMVHFEDNYISLNKWYEISAYPSGNGLSVYFKDITERKIAEEAISLSNERYKIVSKATNDSIWDWDIVKNEVERPGKTLESILGYGDIKPAEVDNFWKRHVQPEDWKRLTQKRKLLLENPIENYWEDEYRFLKPDGTFAYIYDRAYIIRDTEKKAIRMIGASQDFSKLKENELQLKVLNENLEKRAHELLTSNAELEQFAYIASHDLQEPLRMISSFLTLLEKKYNDLIDEKGKQYIYFAVDGAKRMRQIILDLLEYSRVGRAAGMQEKVNLNELVKEVLVLYRNKIEEKRAVIKINKLPVLLCLRTPLRQVFQNLVSNSLKYYKSEDGKIPKINISCKATKTHWIFSIKDNGIGIDASCVERIFIIFQRLHNSDEYPGTGMGLAIAKKIIETMGGKIWVASEEGKGSTFYFSVRK